MSGRSRNGNNSKVIGTLTMGNGKTVRKNVNCTTTIRANGSGNVVMDQVQDNGRLHEDNTNGRLLVIEGQHSADLMSHAMDSASNRQGMQNGKLRVAVELPDGSPKFKGRFKMDETVYEIRVSMNKEYSNKKVSRIQHSETGKEIDENTTIKDLVERNWLTRLTAVVVESSSK